AYLADALFEIGQVDEARALLAQIRADAPSDAEVYRTVAEVLYAQGDVAGAYEWATTGADVVLATTPAADDSLEGLLPLRYRSRIDLGRPEDRYDAMLDDLLRG